VRGANRFEEDALKHGRDDLIFFIREEKIVRGKRTRTSLRKRRKKRETRADKERAFKGSIRIARINIMHKYKRKTQTHTYLSYCDTQTSIVLLLWEALSCIIFHSLSFLLAYFPLFLSAQNEIKRPSFPPPSSVVHSWPHFRPNASLVVFPTFPKKDIIRRIRSKLQNTHTRLFVSLNTHTHTRC